MTGERLVLVPLDGSEAAKTAIPAAHSLATARNIAIAFVHVGEDRSVSEKALRERLGIAERDRLLQGAGDSGSEICRIADENAAWAIVMSTQAETAAREARFGGTLAAVIGKTDRAVIAIRPNLPESRRALSRISVVVLPLDGSPAAAAAVGPARELAREFGGELQLLHVPVSVQAAPGQAGTLVGPKYLDAPYHEWSTWEDEFVRRFGTEGAAGDDRVAFHTAAGDPVEQILRFAEERGADLIGIAWRQNFDAGHAKIVKRLLAESQCPLLFVPARSEAS